MASSSDSEEDVGLSNRKRAVRVRTRVLEDDPGNPRTDLFGDRELYAAEGESGDSESSLDKIKSSFAAEGECDPKRGGLKVSRKKDIRKMRIETQRILRASSMKIPSYQPKKKSLDDFLTKLHSQRQVPLKGPSACVPPGDSRGQPVDPLEKPDNLQLSSEVDRFQDKFAHHFQVQGPKGRGCSVGLNRGMGLHQLKSRLWEDLAQRRAAEMRRLEEIRRFEEDEGLDLGEEADAEFTDTSSDESEGEEEQAPCKGGGALSTVTEGSIRGSADENRGGAVKEDGDVIGTRSIEDDGNVIKENGAGVGGSSGGGQLVVEESSVHLSAEVDDGSRSGDGSDGERSSRCVSEKDQSLSQLRNQGTKRRRVLDSGDECEDLPQTDVGSHSASPGHSLKDTLTGCELSQQDLFSDATALDLPVAGQGPTHHTSDLPPMEETRFLDTQGFLCIREPQPALPSALPHLLAEDVGHTDVLELCSGHFGSTPSPQDVSKGVEPSTQAMCDLLGIQMLGHSRSPSPPHSLSQQEAAEADKNLLKPCSSRSATPPLTVPQPLAPPTADASDNAVDGVWSDEDMPVLRWKQSRVVQRPTQRELLEQFVESEAELSGSDVSSDEEDKHGSELDQYEEEGAGSDVPHSDSELHQQVNKIHMKQLLADDKADLREFKERFLADGDLVEDGLLLKDGLFRKRKLAYMGSEASLDLFGDDRTLDSGGEDVDEDSDDLSELNRRRVRVEKEQYLRFMRSRQGSLLDEDEESQSVLSFISTVTAAPVPRPSLGVTRPQCGSFLKRSHSQLKRMALGTSAVPSIQGKKGFVFQAAKECSQDASTHPPQVHEPDKKRLKIDQGPALEDSVFRILQ